MAETRKTSSKGKKTDTSKPRSRKALVTAAKAGAAIGIGSAALVAALLYANRTQPDEEPKPANDPRFEPLDS
jgi:hypothetical protein